MKEVNGFKYSRDSFEEYKLRLVLSFDYNYKIFSIDIYTTNTNIDNALSDILNQVNKEAKFIKIDHCATKQQDKTCSKMIDDWLSEIKGEQK